MPELKNNFVQGRMNKDLDERIIPNGAYRDALNIQIATSEQSDVGTIQNIIGNVKIESLNHEDDYSNLLVDNVLYPKHGKCVATIADEKSNSLYFFVRDNSFDHLIEMQNDPWDYFIFKDQILEYDQTLGSAGINNLGSLKAVFIDTHTVISRINPNAIYAGDWANYEYTLMVPTPPSGNHVNAVKVGMQVMGYNPVSGNSCTSAVASVNVDMFNNGFVKFKPKDILIDDITSLPFRGESSFSLDSNK